MSSRTIGRALRVFLLPFAWTAITVCTMAAKIPLLYKMPFLVLGHY